MQWRVVVELSGAVGVIQVHEVHSGGSIMAGCSAATLGLSLAEAKTVLAGLQRAVRTHRFGRRFADFLARHPGEIAADGGDLVLVLRRHLRGGFLEQAGESMFKVRLGCHRRALGLPESIRR